MTPKRTKSPSYYRRLEARAAARAAKARTAAEEASAEEAARSVVEDSINTAVQTAEEAVTKREAEEAAIARVTKAIIVVGVDVAAKAQNIAEKAAIAKKKTEEDIAKKKVVDEAAARKYWEDTANKAARADIEIVPSRERISTVAFLNGTIEKFKDDMMRIPPRSPAPEWFCELLGTRKHHGNVKFIISDPLRNLIGRHSSHMITNYIFTKKLWAFMSHLPLRASGFIPSPEFAKAVYFKEMSVKMIPWSDLCLGLQEHVFFNSSLVGVYSGKKLIA